MKKKLLVGILVLTMLAACLGVSALAADEGTAEELKTAITAADGTLELDKDYKLETNKYATAITIEKDITIDLKGHSITSDQKAFSLILISGANVEITNTGDTTSTISLVKGEGGYDGNTVSVSTKYDRLQKTYTPASLTISGNVEIKGDGLTVISLTGQKSQDNVPYYASLTIADENVKVTGSETTPAISGSLGYGSLNISNGTFAGAITGKNWDENAVISGGSFTVAPDSELAPDGNLFEKSEGGTYSVQKGYEASIGDEQGTLAALVEKAKTSGDTVTVEKSGLTLNLNRFGTTDPEPAKMPTIKLKLAEGVTGLTLTAEKYNGLKVCTIIIEGATSAESIVTTDAHVSGDEVETTEYKLAKQYDSDSKTVTITVTRTMKEAFEVTYVDGRVVKYNLKEFFSNANLESATKVKLLDDVALELEATDKQQQTVTQHMSIRLDDPVDAVKAVDGGKLTFDLNGKTLTYKGDNGAIVSMEGRKVDIITSVAGGTIDASAAKVAISLGATISAKELPDGQGGTTTVTTPNYTSTGSAVIAEGVTVKGTVAIFNSGSSLEVSGTIDGGEKIAISGNGTTGENVGENHGGTTVVIKDGGVVKSSKSAAVYQPQAGETKVEGGEITGAAGIVALDGSVDVTGGSIEATGETNVTLPCGDVPASGIVAENNKNYGDAETAPSVSVSGDDTTISSKSSETVTYKDTTENKVEPDITVSGGTFQSNGNADTSVNQYTVADKAINENTGTVYNYDNEIIAFGYGATRQEAIESAKAARKGTKGEPAATLWDTLDWIDQTFYIVFDEPVPAHKSIDVTVSFAIDGEDYTFTATCNGGDAGTSRMFAWSFLNNDQNTVVGPDGEETKISGTPTGDYTLTVDDNIDLNGHGTVAVEAEDTAIVLPALITTDTTEETLAKAMEVTTANSAVVGQYFEARFKTDKLPMTKPTDGTTTTTAYWLGWAMKAPTGATKYQYRWATTDEALANEGWTTVNELDANLTGANTETDKGIAVYYDVAKIDTAKTWLQVQFIDASGKQYGTYVVHVVMDEVTFAPPTGATDPVVTAKMANQDGSEGDLASKYEITDQRWNDADGVYDVVIDATAVKAHYNDQGKLGYWVGFAAKAPAGATKFSWVDGKDITALTNLQEVGQLEQNVYVTKDTAGTEKKEAGVAYYLDAKNLESGYRYLKIEWKSDSATVATITYRVSLKVTTEEPTAPEIYGAITGEVNEIPEVTVALTKDTAEENNIGYYYEVTLDVGQLSQTISSVPGQSGNKYYTGIALPAPEKAAKFKYLFVDKNRTDFTLEKLSEAGNTAQELELNVYEGKSGVAFYVTIKADDLTLNKEWIALQWLNDQDEVIGTYFIHLTTKNVLLQVEGLDITTVVAGFKAAADEAKAGLEEAIKTVVSTATPDITDAGTNMIYVAFAGTATGKDQDITIEIKKDGSDAGFELTDAKVTLKYAAEGVEPSKGGYFYFSFDNDEQFTGDLAAGDYTINLKSGTTVVASATVTINEVKFALGDGVTGVDEVTVPGYFVDANDYNEADVKATPIPEDATCESGSHLEWVVTEENGVYTATLTAVANRPVSGGGASATTSKVTTPENGSVELSSTTARGGQTVTVTATPDEGYDVGDVIVKDRNGNPVEVTRNDDGTYSYTVPAGKTPVTVEVIFDECLCDDFADLDLDEWYHEAVDYAIKSELMLGQGDGWHPTDAVRGAEIFVILGRLDGAGLETGGDKWYDESLAWAMEKGYTDGSTPLANCSRERAVTLLWRYYGEQASDADITGFVDAADVSDWAIDAMKWAVENEIIKGLDNNDIQPRKDLTRAEFATILERLEAAPATETAE